MISVPAVESSRYYSIQLIDMYTFNFAYVGTRATGNAPGHYLLAGPDWIGEKPAGVHSVIKCEMQFAFNLFRTRLFNPGDIENVKKVQAGYRVHADAELLVDIIEAARTIGTILQQAGNRRKA